MTTELPQSISENITDIVQRGNETLLTTDAAALLDVCQSIADAGFTYPADVTAFDDGQMLKMVYRFYSIAENRYMVVSVPVARKGGRMPTVSGIWRGAEWFEREVHDLFGITFDGHLDLRPLIIPPGIEGYPLLKDFLLKQEGKL
jgi:NADH-quinone oxidoreductase subunit C